MADPLVLDGVAAVRAAVGRHLGWSPWVTVDQDRIDRFADATGDHQWIHVDRDGAAAEGPHGTTIAHGYLTLSLVANLRPLVVDVRGFTLGINYGTDRVRFPAPVPAGSRVRAGVELVEVTDVPGGIQTRETITVEVDGGAVPACVADLVSRFLA